MTATEIKSEKYNQGESSNFLCFCEKITNKINPICNKRAVYLLLKAKPMAIPPRIQKIFLSSKIALYKQIKLSVQNNKRGTSGVELKDKIDIKIVEANKTNALCNFCFDKK